MKNLTILIVDDEDSQRESLKSFLGRRVGKTLTAKSGADALRLIENETVDIVLTDYRMPGMDGLQLLRKVKQLNPGIDVVVITAYGSVENAVDIMKAGAFDYLSKPVDLDELEELLKRIREHRLLVSENKQLKEQLREKYKFEGIISNSGEMEQLLSTAARVAPSRATVLIRGESGTGKELIAKAIHHSSDRKEKPFITVNVASLSESLMESELFGHEKGAFTGAVSARPGRFEEADGGTLFIDEVGDIPPTVQVKLLRALQFGEVQRLGSNETKQVNVRILAATHRDLETMIEKNEFREDLFYRINVVTLLLPPLRDRRSDIAPLTEHFIKKYAEENGKQIEGISREALDTIMKYDWPGNIRELENTIERAIVLTREETVTTRDLSPQLTAVKESSSGEKVNLEEGYENLMKQFETTLIQRALKETDGNQSAAARLLGMSERHLRSRLERLGLK